MQAVEDLPLPPLELANRVGCLDEAADPLHWYRELGANIRAGVLAALPDDWALEGKRVLDFGCGAGRTLRHFVPDANKTEFWGCDIDGRSVAWLQEHLSPPLRVFRNTPMPPLEVADGTFDLVYAISVFTHLTDTWAEWLAELHRVLVPGGLLLATFMGEGAIAWVSDEPWVEERIGMNVMSYGQSWDLGGPMVIHSPWWIRAHWGRLFEICELRPSGFGCQPGRGHGTVLMCKRDHSCTVENLQTLELGEPREAIALEHNRRRLFAETAALQAQQQALSRELSNARAETRQAQAALRRITSSRSWRATEPLRRGAGWLRQGRAYRRVELFSAPDTATRDRS